MPEALPELEQQRTQIQQQIAQLGDIARRFDQRPAC